MNKEQEILTNDDVRKAAEMLKDAERHEGLKRWLDEFTLEVATAEKKRIENLIIRSLHDHKDKECEHDKALKELLKKI